MSQGSLLILFERPISGVISTIALVFFALPLLQGYLRRARRSEVPVVSSHDG
jgi:TctA family transporter